MVKKLNKEQTQESASRAGRSPASALSWIVFAALGAMLVWSCRNFFDYGDLFAQLSGQPMIERGRIGANEWRSFLARSGRGGMQKNHRQQVAQLHQMLEQARRAGQDSLTLVIDGRPTVVRSERDLRSRVADSWAWVAAAEQALPQDARVLMNIPESSYYYIASTFWHPRGVDVSFEPMGVRDDQQLRDVFLKDRWRLDPRQFEELARQAKAAGYTHIAERRNGEPTLIELRGATGGATP